MRYLLPVLFALCLTAHALTHHTRLTMRRRSRRVRRYAQNVRPARPNVITGPIPLITAWSASRAHVPLLLTGPAPVWDAPRADRFRFGVAALVDLARPSSAVAG